MRHYLLIVSIAALLLIAPIHAQEGIGPKQKNDDPPPTARLRIGTTKLRESDRMKGIDFLPDGKHVVTTKGPIVHYWNLESGFMVNAHTFQPPKVKSGTVVRPPFRMYNLRSTAIAPDGKSFAAIINNEVWSAPIDLKASPEYVKLSAKRSATKALGAIGFAQIEKNNAVVTLDEAGWIEVVTNDKEKIPARIPTGIATPKYFAVGGTHCVVANEEGFGVMVNMATRKRIGQIAEMKIRSISLTPDGKILAIRCNESDLLLWDVEKNEQIARRKVDANTWSIALSPEADRNLSTVVKSGIVELRDLKSDKSVLSDKIDTSLSGAHLAFSHDGKRCAVLSQSGVIHVWDTPTGKPLAPTGYMGPITALHWLRAGDLLAASKDTTVIKWDTKTGKEKQRFEKQAESIRSWTFRSDDKFVFSNLGLREVRKRNLADGTEQVIFEAGDPKSSDGFLSGVALSPDERTLAVATTLFKNPTIDLISLDQKKATTKLTVAVDIFAGKTDVSFVTNDVLLTRTGYSDIRIWDLKKSEVVREFKAGANPVSLAGLSVDAVRRIVVTPDRKFYVGIDLLDARASKKDQKRIISFWDLETGKQAKHFFIDGLPCALAMSADGKTIITGDSTGAVHVWDAASTNRILHEPAGHRGPVTAIAIAPDGRSFATGSVDTSILIWDLPNTPRPK